ncbi:MAG: ABC transporter permease [Thermomicrobiales bacterium]|nr:ABC transporter permease [Thermomicrobiales bacterium]
MNEIFGLSMTAIMIALVIMLAICLLVVAWIALRRAVVFKLGVRNIPRRKAQTVLIVVGLMLSTLIIAAALGTGDTIDHSATAATYDSLGAADELVVASKDDDGEGNFVNAVDQLLPQSVTERIEAEFAGTDLIDGVLPVLIHRVPAIKLVDGQPSLSEPSTYLVGIDPVRAEDFGGLQDTDGNTIDLANIGLTEVVISEDLADALEAKAGDTIAIYYNNAPIELTVAAVAEDSPLSGKFDQSTPGMVVPLDRLQAATQLEGQVTTIAVSNRGGIESGMELTDEVSDRLIALFAGDNYGVDKIKQNNIEFAEIFANIFTSIFLVFGLFSIAVGILLIVLIFTMLAAERRPEMGMTRAVGAQRRQLMQQFVAEGTAYALAAGLIGAALGVAAAYAIGYAVRPIFGEFLTISPHVTPRSMVIAYCLGVVITFIAVVISSWRISHLNIVAAIRDITEVPRAGSEHGVLRRGKVKSALVILALGLVGIVAGVALSASGSTAEDATSGEQALAGLGSVASMLGGILFIWGLHRVLRPFWAIAFVLGGIAGTILGQSETSAFLFYGGMSLLPFGIAMLLRFFGVSGRLVFSIAGLYIVVLWLLPPGPSESLFGDLGGGIEMFFLSGIFMVAGATIVIVQNMDALLAAVTWMGGIFRSRLPAVRTAVAFPGAAKGRTGMTIAMFSLIVFSLVVFATINQNFTDIFLSDEANAGWDVRADSSGANPIGGTEDFLNLVASRGIDTADIVGAGNVTATFQNNMRRPGMEEWKFFPLVGMDERFLTESEVFFQQRATGYADDAAIIEALRTEPDVVVVSAFALVVEGDFGEDPTQFTLEDPDGDGPQTDLTSDDKVFDPISVEIEGLDGQIHTVRVIGVIDTKISTLFGMYGLQSLTSRIKPDPSVISYFLRLSDPENAESKANQIEEALVTSGVQGTSIQDELEESQRQSTGFLYIFQGFMGLGLVVGIAAVGVIAFRSVVERRQQIGVLRAIGYQQSLVSLSFLIETLFVVGMGVISGTVLGLILARNLFSSEDFTGVEDATFTVPWLLVAIILIVTIIASLLMTLVPARQASRLAPAEALRYE